MTPSSETSPEHAHEGLTLPERVAAYIAAAEFLNEDPESPYPAIDIELGISEASELDRAMSEAYGTNPNMAAAFWGESQHTTHANAEPTPEPFEAIYARQEERLKELRKENSPFRKFLGNIATPIRIHLA